MVRRSKELRVVRWDESHTPYSQEEFLTYYTPESAWKLWSDAVIYKDADGKIVNVLVRIGQQSRWGLAEQISGESAVLAGMLSCDDGSPVLDLRAIVGCDISIFICSLILDYLCSFDSSWWEQAPTMGALDLADKLGLERLLSSIVRPHKRTEWITSRWHIFLC